MSDTLSRLTSALSDRYAIEHELGQGGMAIVYLATDLKQGRQVAIKVMRPELAAAVGVERFLREIEIAAKLRHPNILPLYDSGEVEGFLYYVMPFVEGESLRDRLNREQQLPLADAIRIATEVAGALSLAHRENIVHRDIKPENILLEDGHAVVADFGIARAVDESGGGKLTQTGVAIGTPAYMSPEQAGGERKLDGRSDLYALGCVLYEMLAGEQPYTGATTHAVIAKIFSDPVPSVRRLRSAVPEEVDATIAKAMEKSPADRFSTASDFIEALNQPIADVRPGKGVTVNRWVLGAPAALAVGVALWFGFGLGDRIFGGGASVEPVSLVLGAASIPGTDSSLALVMRMALERALLESPIVEVMTPEAVMSALVSMGREPSATLDSATATEVAVRTGAAGIVMPGIQRLGASFVLSARLVSREGELQAIANAQADDSTGLLPAIDVLARDLRRQLGESRASLRQSQNLSFLLTPSLEAVRLTAQALALMRSGRPHEMGGLVERAIALDSNFAMGHVLLLLHRQVAGGDYLAPMERSLALKDRLSSETLFIVEWTGALYAHRAPARALASTNAMPGEVLGTLRNEEDRLNWESILANVRGLAFLERGEPNRAMQVHKTIIDAETRSQFSPVMPAIFFNQSMALAQWGDSVAAERAWRRNLADYPSKGLEPYFALAGQQWARAAATAHGLAPVLPDEHRATMLALLGTVEAIRGRPQASRAAFAAALEVAMPVDEFLSDFVLFHHASTEFYLLDEARARVPLAQMLAGTQPKRGLHRRLHAGGQALAAAICSQAPGALTEVPGGDICDLEAEVDSTLDDLEALELLGWQALGNGRPEDAIRIGSTLRLIDAGGPGWRARTPAALAYEAMGQPDSAAAVYDGLVRAAFGLINHAQSAILMRSYGLRRLVALGGDRADSARAVLQRDWVDAEPEFRTQVADPVLGR